MKKFELLDFDTAKANLIAQINKSYWGIKPKEIEMQVKVKEQPESKINQQMLFGKNMQPEINYELGEKRNFSSGPKGKDKLIRFLAELSKCGSTADIVILIEGHQKLAGSNFANTLLYALPECARETNEIVPVENPSARVIQALKIIGEAEHRIAQQAVEALANSY